MPTGGVLAVGRERGDVRWIEGRHQETRALLDAWSRSRDLVHALRAAGHPT
ncbi:hypothetical protein [Streptomyces achromogenes]|uniref:hypothetical protein n=1 Tax=Streptomyces achromogenes TaxID=67255 RepID=UPI0036988A52